MSLFDAMSDQRIEVIKRILNISKALFTPAAIIFLLIMAWKSKDVVIQIFNQASIGFMIIAICGWALLYLFYPAFLVTMTKAWDGAPTFKDACFIHINRLPARYIPGGIWHTVARFSDFQRGGLGNRQLTALLLLENILSLVLALFIGSIILIYYQTTSLWLIIFLCSILLAGCMLVVSPYLANRIVLKETESIRLSNYLLATLILSVYWIFASLIFVLYLDALLGMSGFYESVRQGGIYLFSWGVGYLAFFAPQGIGVFELVAGELLQGEYSLSSVAVLIAGFRVVILCADILAWSTLKIFMSVKPK